MSNDPYATDRSDTYPLDHAAQPTDAIDGLFSSHEEGGELPPSGLEESAELAQITADSPLGSSIVHSPDTVPIDPALREAVHIEPMVLTEEFARLPGDMARWNELYAEAHERYLMAKLNAERTRSRRALYIRRNSSIFASTYGVKMTESAIMDILNTDKEVMAAEDVTVYADRERTRLRGIMSALVRKSEALVSIGAQLRAEMTFHPHLNNTNGQSTSNRGR